MLANIFSCTAFGKFSAGVVAGEDHRRAWAMGGTIGLHAVFLIGLLFSTVPKPGFRGEAERGMAVFDVGPIVGATAPSASESAQEVQAHDANSPMDDAAVEDANQSVSLLQPSIVAAGASGGQDPFARVAFASATDAADQVPPSKGGKEADSSVVRDVLLSFRTTHPDVSGTASFVLTVRSDGSVQNVRYLAGTVGAEVGAALAGMLEGVKLFPNAATPTRTIWGPIAVGDCC